MNPTFKICRHCGNLVELIQDKKVPVVCCGEKMEELVPNTVEASGEKHVPVVTVADGKVEVNVGAVNHPMIPEHFIQWVALETDQGVLRQTLQPGEAPAAVFALGTAKPVAVYAYCDLHGLWKTSL